MECTVKWAGNMTFIAETGRNHILTMDGAIEGGGRNLAPRPMEAILSGAGGCAAYDVVYILKRSRKNIQKCEVTLSAERSETEPKVFVSIHLTFRIQGQGLDQKIADRAVDLSVKKYCSALAMIEKTAKISHEVLVEEAEQK